MLLISVAEWNGLNLLVYVISSLTQFKSYSSYNDRQTEILAKMGG